MCHKQNTSYLTSAFDNMADNIPQNRSSLISQHFPGLHLAILIILSVDFI